MAVKTFNYKKGFSSYRLNDWKAPLSGTEMGKHMEEMSKDGWRVIGQVSTSRDLITVTYAKD